MFADSFSVLSIHCVARGLGVSFLYKCLHRVAVQCDSTPFLLNKLFLIIMSVCKVQPNVVKSKLTLLLSIK